MRGSSLDGVQSKFNELGVPILFVVCSVLTLFSQVSSLPGSTRNRGARTFSGAHGVSPGDISGQSSLGCVWRRWRRRCKFSESVLVEMLAHLRITAVHSCISARRHSRASHAGLVASANQRNVQGSPRGMGRRLYTYNSSI